MSKFAVSFFFACYFFMFVNLASIARSHHSTAAESTYCRVLELNVQRRWKNIPGFDSPVIIDFDVDAEGRVKAIGAAKEDTSSSQARATALVLIALFDTIQPPPLGPLKMQIVLCNRPQSIRVKIRDAEVSKTKVKAPIKMSTIPRKY